MKVRFKDIDKRMLVMVGILILCTLVVFGRLSWLQVVIGGDLKDRLQNQMSMTQDLQSPRGTIYDRNGRELAISIMTKSLFVDPKDVMENKEIDAATAANLIAPLVDVKPEIIMQKIADGGRFAWIKRHLEPSVAQRVREVCKENKIRGFAFHEESKRFYPNGKLAAQVLGCVGTEDKGLLGIEYQTDTLLKGSMSRRQIETDNMGRPISHSVYDTEFVRDGKDVYLTIDSNIQFIVEAAMDEAMEVNKTQKGAAIVIDPRTGEILAMVSRPTFDPNDFGLAANDTFLNRGISYIYEPGSTFKSIVAAIALEEKAVTPDEHFIDSGWVEVSGRVMKNWDGEGNGDVTFTDIIKNSLNTGFVQVGLRIGAERLMNYAKKFGFGDRTGIELPGEEYGILFESAKDMVGSDIATMSIGQSIAATPIQLIMAVSSLANDGVLLQPRLIREIKNADGTVYEAHEDKIVVRQTVSEQTAATMRQLLEKVVSEGGGVRAQVAGYRIAGKTGTAEKLNDIGSGYESGAYIASFVGFAPVDNPRIAVIVMIDDPAGNSYYGGVVAAPVAGKILSEVMRYLDILPEETIEAELPKSVRQAPTEMPTVEEKSGMVEVPDVRGKTMKEAMRALRSAGLTMVPEGTGVAVEQNVAPYSSAQANSEVRVRFEPR